MDYIIKVLEVKDLTHDVKRFRCEKPGGYQFVPGQATELAINKEGWREEKRPFTFTSLRESPYLEFVIKIYPDHAGVTNELNAVKKGDELIIGEAWGAIEYKGPGYFIAGGAGITPFIAILRQLNKEGRLKGNKLLFSNKTGADIILREELTGMMNGSAIYVTTDEPVSGFHFGFMNEAFLKSQVDDVEKHFYLCGPPKMVEDLEEILKRLGARPDAVVFEK